MSGLSILVYWLLLLGISGFQCVLPTIAMYFQVLPRIAGNCKELLCFAGYCLVVQGIAGYFWVFPIYVRNCQALLYTARYCEALLGIVKLSGYCQAFWVFLGSAWYC